jgi:hypothetical protein
MRSEQKKRGSTPFLTGMREFKKRGLTPILLAVVASSAFAHHGWRGYQDVIEMAVSVTELKLGNPHDRLIATDESGQEWNLLLAPPARNRRFGFSEESIAVGDAIVLYGQKHPDRHEIKVHCLYRDDEMLYTYRYDNGRSSLSRSRSTDKEAC